MTGVGRGRGWDLGVPLRRPGVTSDMEVDSLITAVQGIKLSGDGDCTSTLKGVEEILRNQCQSEEALRSVVQRLHDRSLEDRKFGMKAAAAYATVSTLEIAGVKLRNVLLQAVQNDFENKEHLQTSCNIKFLNAIALLGEIFHRVRMPDGSPINILATAVLHYQDMLLAGEEHELELFTTQLAVNGRKLFDCRAAELEELMLRARITLMSRNLSGQCRCWLLLALDLAANRYAPLSGQLQSFYQIHLGANAIMQLQRIQLGLTVQVAAPAPTQVGSDGDGILAKCKVADNTNKVLNVENGVVIRPSVKVVRSNSEVSSKSPPSGRKHNQDKNWRKSGGSKNDDIWGSTRGEKSVVWGHDDRFTKDDDFYGKQLQRGEGTSRPRNRDSTNWREKKSSDGGKDQKTAVNPKSTVTPKNDGTKTKNSSVIESPPPLPDEENWD
ncbi:hypothetical protein L9F63_020076 [Diploptera punctata]|uniref:CBP80/20-dependent translation initiation factor n=1 Tax=Diploptera punctata TaxID=6984 RepID=A0AAD7ZTA9_DIPPU|nr:hypothetical protein L9F63_020076 [Diploptera punctata]